VLGEAELVDLLLEPLLPRAGAEDAQPPVGVGRDDLGEGGDEQVEALLLVQPPGGDDDLAVRVAGLAAGERRGVGDALDPGAGRTLRYSSRSVLVSTTTASQRG